MKLEWDRHGSWTKSPLGEYALLLVGDHWFVTFGGDIKRGIKGRTVSHWFSKEEAQQAAQRHFEQLTLFNKRSKDFMSDMNKLKANDDLKREAMLKPITASGDPKKIIQKIAQQLVAEKLRPMIETMLASEVEAAEEELAAHEFANSVLDPDRERELPFKVRRSEVGLYYIATMDDTWLQGTETPDLSEIKAWLDDRGLPTEAIIEEFQQWESDQQAQRSELRFNLQTRGRLLVLKDTDHELVMEEAGDVTVAQAFRLINRRLEMEDDEHNAYVFVPHGVKWKPGTVPPDDVLIYLCDDEVDTEDGGAACFTWGPELTGDERARHGNGLALWEDGGGPRYWEVVD